MNIKFRNKFFRCRYRSFGSRRSFDLSVYAIVTKIRSYKIFGIEVNLSLPYFGDIYF